jgi:hypothetical protein
MTPTPRRLDEALDVLVALAETSARPDVLDAARRLRSAASKSRLEYRLRLHRDLGALFDAAPEDANVPAAVRLVVLRAVHAAEIAGGPTATVELAARIVVDALVDPDEKPRGAAQPLEPGTIVSEDRAARSLPLRRADAVAWLRREGLSVAVDGRHVVAVDPLLARLSSGPAPAASTRAHRRDARPHNGPAPLAAPGRCLD